uniref:Mitochondrial ribosomal protein S14 n=1 Tax=Riptortus pedestris TaxID=329032 RepID=R4WQS3_RIPPE|nr:mitochondrial ribosomal protein S14 [Riptortus pedestris]
MAGLNLLRNVGGCCGRFYLPGVHQVRTALLWADWRMKKDARKRQTLADNAVMKLRYNSLRKNNALPPEIRVLGDELLKELPRDAVGIKVRARCAFTSRANGNVLKHRVSRIVYRDLADHNRLSGIQRAMW